MDNMMDNIINDLYRSIELKKNNLIKEKLIENGYKEYAETLTTARFPKVACIVDGEWNYYYADNGTPDGEFIIAIKQYEVDPSFNGITASHSVGVHFKWHCTPPRKYGGLSTNIAANKEILY